MTGRVEAVERALRILGAFSADRGALPLSELAVAARIHKATTLRLCRTLESFDYLRRDADGRYRIGPAVHALGALYWRHYDPEAQIRPVLAALVKATGETASFYAREGEYRVCLFRHEATQAIRHHVEEGEVLTLDSGAAGHVLKAFGPEGDWAVQTAGYATSLGERDPHAAAIAAPVFGHDKRLLGALCVSGLKERFTDDVQAAISAAVVDAAEQLSQALGAP